MIRNRRAEAPPTLSGRPLVERGRYTIEATDQKTKERKNKIAFIYAAREKHYADLPARNKLRVEDIEELERETLMKIAPYVAGNI